MNSVSREISDETLNRIITIESAGNPRAKAATSSASGLGQFIAGTWLTMVQRHRPDWMEGRTRQQVLDLRFDPKKNIEMLARFTEENARMIPGEKDADGDLYLAHFAGVGVAKNLFRAPGNDPAEKWFSPAAVQANRSIIAGKTVGQVRAWAEKKMRNAGGRDWIAKYWNDPVRAEIVAQRAAEEAPEPPKDADPENEWTFPEPKKEGQGVEGALKFGGLSGLIAVLAELWEKISQAPESLLTAVIGLLQKPSVWVALLIVGASVYGVYRWRKYRRESE